MLIIQSLLMTDREEKSFPLVIFVKWRRWINSCINNVNYSVITHLLFANDILLFVEDHDKSIENMRIVIHLFELASGLSINLNKSNISPINVASNRADRVAASWSIKHNFFLPIIREFLLGISLISKDYGQTSLKKYTRR